MLKVPCLGCGCEVDVDEFTIPANWQPTAYCDACLDRIAKGYSAKSAQDAKRRAWEAICPQRYRDTVLERLPYPERSARVLEHNLSTGLGLNLWGFPDTGKTRTLFLILERMHRAGSSIAVFGPGDFSVELQKRDFRRASFVNRLFRVDVLAFDDMDKMSLTKDQELTFFAVLDKRMSNRLPCLFTHNSTAADLEYKFRNGGPMVRRIRQFTSAFHFPERTLL